MSIGLYGTEKNDIELTCKRCARILPFHIDGLSMMAMGLLDLLCLILKRYVLFGLLCLLAAAAAARAEAPSLSFSTEEKAWVAAHREQTFTVGFDPYSGMDVFDFRGVRTGLLPALLAEMQKELGVRLVMADVAGWDDAYSRFVNGKIDILYGANPTPERERIMTFTRPALRYPYVVFARKDSSVQTLGDLDGRRVGFIANDFVSQQLPKEYPNIHYQTVEFSEQEQGLRALISGAVDGFITSGGGVENDFLFNYPVLTMIAELQSINSDMTFAVLKDQALLGGLINKYVEQRQGQIQTILHAAARTYSRKILRLTEAELNWLEQKGEAVVGVADDYLPFDLYQDGQYKGIAGETLNRISDIIGMRFKVEHGPFAEIYEKARTGLIDVVNIAKTEDRLQYFLYPRPISTERDIIVGQKTSPPVQDVYGLEDKRVVVIDGFWHEEYLLKNLKRARIVKTPDILESLRLLRRGDVDYLIENPTVVEFYINGLGYTDLVKRGNTSKDSFVYFGVNRQQPELAAIMDKVLTLVKFEDMKYAGIQSVPTLRNEESRQLAMIVTGLVVALVLILFVTGKIVFSLADQKAQTVFLKERERLLYIDVLTGFQNRNCFSHRSDELQKGACPQAVLMADLNNLKRVNDSEGHASGDALLVSFAKVLRECFPDGKIFRIGGDEFLVILDKTPEEEVAAALELLKARCQETRHPLVGGNDIALSAAVGYVVRQDGHELLDDAIRAADRRMYEAKAQMKKRRTDTI